MSDISLPMILLVVVPLLLVWAFVVVEILREQQLPVGRKVLWVLACTLVWPMLLAYLLLGPQRGRAERAVDQGERDDAHDRLVDAVLAHEDGRIDAGTFARTIGELRGMDGPG